MSKSRKEEEKEIWAREEEYWTYMQTGDLERFSTLFSPNLVAWPNFTEEPIDKARVMEAMVPLLADFKSSSFTYTLSKYAIDIYGDIAQVFFLCTMSFTNKEGEQTTSHLRFLHNWLKEDGKWVLIGGMNR